MREIKFRAWDKYISEFVDINDKYADEVYIGQGGRVHTYSCDEGGCSFSAGATEHERYDITWYTGLKDKNGKEIYEGDIVQLTTELQGTRIFRIEWDEDCYMLRNNEQELGAVASTMKQLGEVIGNIYENKELLNEAK